MGVSEGCNVNKLDNLLADYRFGDIKSISNAGRLVNKVKKAWENINVADRRTFLECVAALRGKITDKQKSCWYRFADFFVRFFTRLQSGRTVLESLKPEALKNIGIDIDVKIRKLEDCLPGEDAIKKAELNLNHFSVFQVQDVIPPLEAKIGTYEFDPCNYATIEIAEEFKSAADSAADRLWPAGITYLEYRAYNESGAEVSAVMTNLEKKGWQYLIENADREILELLEMFENLELPEEESEKIGNYDKIPLIRYDDRQGDVATFEGCRLRFYAVIIGFAKGKFWTGKMDAALMTNLQNVLRHLVRYLKNASVEDRQLILVQNFAKNFLTCADRTEEGIMAAYNGVILKENPNTLSLEKMLNNLLANFRYDLLTKSIINGFFNYKNNFGEINGYDESSALKHYRATLGAKWGVITVGGGTRFDNLVGKDQEPILKGMILKKMEEACTPQAILNYVVELLQSTPNGKKADQNEKLQGAFKAALQSYLETRFDYFSEEREINPFLLDDEGNVKFLEIAALILEDFGVLKFSK